MTLPSRLACLAARLLLPAVAVVCLLTTVPASLAAAAPSVPAPSSAGPRAFVPDEAIVRFEPSASASERRAARRQAGVRFDDSLGVPRVEVVAVEGSVTAAVAELRQQPEVSYAQPNYRYEALEAEAPDDTFFDSLWGLSDSALPDPGVRALDAWDRTRGGGQVIAVVDTGVDLTHPDLAPNLWTNPAPGSAQDLHGYDFVDDDGDPDDYEFHGTHVAGTAAAVESNGIGIAGVAPDAQVMAVRVLDGDGSGSTADIAAGIAYAANHGADVINLSLGGPGSDKAMSNAVDLAASKDAVVVAAAGNDGENNDTAPTVPCTLPQANLICVAALNQSGALAGFSNFGAQSVDIAAPGTRILSAKVDYGPPVFSDGFEPEETGVWATFASNGGVPWGTSTSAAGGVQSRTDSPAGDYGQALDPSEWAASELFTVNQVDLTGERGCRLHFRTRYEIEPPDADGSIFDAFAAGAVGGESFDGRYYAGTSPAYPTSGFEREEASISDLDGRADVRPVFAVLSDESLQFDGAYVDDVRLICRDETYADAVSSTGQYDQPSAGSYVEFQGTSMAAPHVAGVAALVRAAVPGTTATEAVDAILNGGAPMPAANPARPTKTQRIADACNAISFAQAASLVVGCGTVTVDELPPGTVTEAEEAIEVANPPAEISPPPAPAAPQTFFRKRPSKVLRTHGKVARAVFRFGADQAGGTFLCKLDRARFRACGSRLARRFDLGRHVLKVKAVGPTGAADVTPAVFRFRVVRAGG